MSHSSVGATLACHGEDADHKIDAPVAQKRHLRLVPVALFGLLLGLDGGPDADPEDQQVEEDHNSHSGDVQSHDGAAVVWMQSAASSLDGAACMCLCAGRVRSCGAAEAPGTATVKLKAHRPTYVRYGSPLLPARLENHTLSENLSENSNLTKFVIIKTFLKKKNH